jgi:MoaA/NifB/PqqE/SkfB family radical SAM enzyme
VKDKFCILPWKHLTVSTEGSYKLCCVARKVATDGGAPMSVYHHSLEHAWNSDYMREIRRAMLANEAVPDCQACYSSEASSGSSYRTTVGASMMDKTIEQVRAESEANDYRVDTEPKFIKLELGNLCNLECRMCGSTTSSQIERDPVHSLWAPAWGFDFVPLVKWDNDVALIGPQPLVGVENAGFSPVEAATEHSYSWTGVHSRIKLNVDESAVLDRLEITLNEAGQQGQILAVVVNGGVLFEGPATAANTHLELDLRHEKIGRTLDIELWSTGPLGEPNHKGVAIKEIRLFRQASTKAELPNRMLFSRLPGRTLWENEDAFIFGEVLGNAVNLGRLYITGGEPFLMKKVIDIIDYLIDSRNTHVILEFSTNCTKITPDLLGKLSKFKELHLALSLDGIGDVHEYIRFPGKWSVIDRNIRLLQQLPNVDFCVTPVVQIYNALNLVDLCRYCDQLNLVFTLANVVHWPDTLRLSVMPPEARLLAAKRLRDYANQDCFHYNKDQVVSVAEHLEKLPGTPSPEIFRKFMLFTNDLDVSRGQKFHRVHHELYHLFQAAGYKWTDETQFARGRRLELQAELDVA